MGKKMRRCRCCGNVFDINEVICRDCGNDLVTNGDILPEATSDGETETFAPTMPNTWANNNYNNVPAEGRPQGYNNYNNAPSDYRSGGYNNVPPYQQSGAYGQYNAGSGNANDQGKSGSGKKGLIALVAVIIVAIAAVAVVFAVKGSDKNNKDDTKKDRETASQVNETSDDVNAQELTSAYTTEATTAPTTAAPTTEATTEPATTEPTTTAPAVKGDIPDFGAFAGDHLISSDKNNALSGKTVLYSKYTIKKDMVLEVVADYVKLLKECDFVFNTNTFYDDDGDLVVVGEYTGTADVKEIYYTLDDGTRYTGEIVIFITENSTSTEAMVKVYYDETFELCTPYRKTDVDVYTPDAAVLPDFGEFAGDEASYYDEEYDAQENIGTIMYKMDEDICEDVVYEYCYLLENYYSYAENDRYDSMDWVGFRYTGSEELSDMTTTFGDGSVFEGHAVHVDIGYYDGYAVVEITYIGDIEMVTPYYCWSDLI